MGEHKNIVYWMLSLLLFTFIVLCVLEYGKTPKLAPTFLKGHRNFYVSIVSGILTGEIAAAITSIITYKYKKNMAVLRLANNLLGIKKCVKEIYENKKGFLDGMKVIKELSDVIMDDPDILVLERELKIEDDFINKLKDINIGYDSESDFKSKALLIAEFIDQYCIDFLKRNKMRYSDFQELLILYNIV